MSGKIWHLADPVDYRFAEAGRRGTWKKENGKMVQVPPLVIEWTTWTTRSDVVGDFAWPGDHDMIIREHVFQELLKRFGGIEEEPVEVIPPKRKRKKKVHPDGSATIWTENLRLVVVRILHHVDLDWDRSRIKTTEENGEIIHEVLGGERSRTEVAPETFEVTSQRIPRVEGGGIFVKASLLEGHSFFKVNPFPEWNLCTDAVRDFILEKQYTNVDFFEVGELF